MPTSRGSAVDSMPMSATARTGPSLLGSITTVPSRADYLLVILRSLSRYEGSILKDRSRTVEFLVVVDQVEELPSKMQEVSRADVVRWAKFVVKPRWMYGQAQSLNLVLGRLRDTGARYWLRWEDSWVACAPFIDRALTLLEKPAEAEPFGRIIDVSVSRGHLPHLPRERNASVWRNERFYFLHERGLTPSAESVVQRRCSGYNVANPSLAWDGEDLAKVWPGFSLRPALSLAAPMVENGPFDALEVLWPFRFETLWSCRLLASSPDLVYSFVLLREAGADDRLRKARARYNHTYDDKNRFKTLTSSKPPRGDATWALRPARNGSGGWLPAQARRCGPPPGSLWIFSPHHKTGHILLESIGRAIAARGIYLPVQWSKRDKFWNAPRGCQTTNIPELSAVQGSCVDANEANVKAGTLLFQYAPCEKLAVCKRFAHALLRAGPNVRMIHFVRDPLEVVLSAYFYHYTSDGKGADMGDRKMLFAPGHYRVQHWSMHCRHPGTDGTISPNAEACLASADAVANPGNSSYQRLLRSLPPHLGILLEAWYALQETIIPQSNALRSLRGPGLAPIVLHVDLRHSREAFGATFTKIFAHLGLPPSHAAKCADVLGHRFDIGSGRASEAAKMHSSSSHTTRAQKQEAARALNASTWFASRLADAEWADAKGTLEANWQVKRPMKHADADGCNADYRTGSTQLQSHQTTANSSEHCEVYVDRWDPTWAAKHSGSTSTHSCAKWRVARWGAAASGGIIEACTRKWASVECAHTCCMAWSERGAVWYQAAANGARGCHDVRRPDLRLSGPALARGRASEGDGKHLRVLARRRAAHGNVNGASPRRAVKRLFEPPASGSCNDEDCSWTLKWACPGAEGRHRRAGNDHSWGYFCCCVLEQTIAAGDDRRHAELFLEWNGQSGSR